MLAKDSVVLLVGYFCYVSVTFSCSEVDGNAGNIGQIVLLSMCLVMGVYLESLNSPGNDAPLQHGWHTRLNDHPGYIYHALLSLCVLAQSFRFKDDYWLGVSILMMVLMMSSIITLGNLHLCRPAMTLPPPMDLWSPAHLALVFMTMCFMSNCKTGTVEWCSFFVLITACQFLFMCVIKMVLQHLPKCFTVGEVMIVSQGFTLYVFSVVIEVIYRLKLSVVGEFPTNDVSYFAKIIVLSAILLCAIPSLSPSFRSIHSYVILIVVIASTMTLPLLWLGLGQNPIAWFLRYLIGKRKAILIGYWLLGTTVAITIVMIYNTRPNQNCRVSTAVRKFFHLVAMAIYIPGLYLDPELLRLASCIALAVFLCLECIRVLRILPFGKVLDDAFAIFLDSQDQGSVILTHIYLLVGCSIPLWLYPTVLQSKDGPPLSLFSGIISLGVGDTAASVVGSKLGRFHWPGSRKTVEGTLAAVFSQLAFCVMLDCYGVVPHLQDHSLAIVIIVILTSLLEAFTSQIDNLVLPLFMYACFQSLCQSTETVKVPALTDL